MNKSAIQKFATWARTELIAQVSQRAYQYGITKDGYGEADAVTVGGRALTSDEAKERGELVAQIRQKGYAQVMEEVAYTWFNRFIALRFMEVNNYLPSHIRIFSDRYPARSSRKSSAMRCIWTYRGLDKEKVSAYIESNQTEELYRYLLLTQCNAPERCPAPDVREDGRLHRAAVPQQHPEARQRPRPDGHRHPRRGLDRPGADHRLAVPVLQRRVEGRNLRPAQKNVKVTKERIPSATPALHAGLDCPLHGGEQPRTDVHQWPVGSGQWSGTGSDQRTAYRRRAHRKGKSAGRRDGVEILPAGSCAGTRSSRPSSTSWQLTPVRWLT